MSCRTFPASIASLIGHCHAGEWRCEPACSAPCLMGPASTTTPCRRSSLQSIWRGKYSHHETDSNPPLDIQPLEPQIMRALCFFNACSPAAAFSVLRCSTAVVANTAAANGDAYRTRQNGVVAGTGGRCYQHAGLGNSSTGSVATGAGTGCNYGSRQSNG